VSGIVWNAVRDGNGITVRHQWNAHLWSPYENSVLNELRQQLVSAELTGLGSGLEVVEQF